MRILNWCSASWISSLLAIYNFQYLHVQVLYLYYYYYYYYCHYIYIIKNVLYITDCKDAAGELHTVEVEMHAERQ